MGSKLERLKAQCRRIEAANALLDAEIDEEKDQYAREKEVYQETKMRRIAMEEICRANREDLFRHMGYVKSFHGYPDQEKREEK